MGKRFFALYGIVRDFLIEQGERPLYTWSIIASIPLVMLGVLGIVVLGLGILPNPASRSTAPASPASLQQQTAWISIDFGNGEKRVFEGAFENGTYSLSSVLQSLARDMSIPLRVKPDTIAYVTKQKRAVPLNIYKDGKLIRKPIRTLLIAAGDHYDLRPKQ